MSDDVKTLWRLIEAIEACRLDEAVPAVAAAREVLGRTPDLKWHATFEAAIAWDGETQHRTLRVHTPAVDPAELPGDDLVFFDLAIEDVVAFVAGADLSGDGWRNADPCTPWDRHGARTLASIVSAAATAADEMVAWDKFDVATEFDEVYNGCDTRPLT